MPDGQYHHYYMDDFTLRSKDGKIPANPSLLVHEVTHAWQYQYAGIIFSVIALECQALKFASGYGDDENPYTSRLNNRIAQ